jgi:hypothetical protein
MQVVDAEVFTRYLAIFRLPFPLDDRLLWAQTLLTNTLEGPAVAMTVVASVVWLITAIWAIGAWGAFRLAYGLGRLRSLGATLIWLGLMASVVWLAGTAAQVA